jgi:type IV pilus assembly protein PilC
MPQYLYKGVDRQGKPVKGEIDLASEGELRMMLRSQGVRPTKIQVANALNKGLGSIMKSSDTMSTEAILVFTRQLQVLISSGIPVVQGLEILQEQMADKSASRIVAAIKDKVSAGSYLWEAIAGFPKAFPKIYVSLIRAGEASGSIDQMLKRLSRYIEDADRVRKMLKSAMMYPIMVVSIGVGVVALMLVFVIPKFEEMLKGSGQELPVPTQFVINLSHLLADNIVYIVAVLIVGGVLGLRFVRSDEGKVIIDRVMFKAPLFGGLMQKAGTARFSRTMGTLLASGVNLIDAIDICKSTIDNAVLESAVGRIRAEVEAGKTLGLVIGKLGVFPKMACQMISVGESTGALDKMLEKVADFYEEEVETVIGGLTKLIEPAILVFLGGTVGGLMIAMYLPIFKLASGVSE